MEEIGGGVLTLVRGREAVPDDTPVSLSDVVADAWAPVDTAAMRLETEADPGIVYADGPLLGRIFENLFRNAREHAGSDAIVRVGTLANGGFYVADGGPNLPVEIRATAFELGERQESSGTGTGLAIVRRIAIAHN
jgi:signal transduction histidine kinase